MNRYKNKINQKQFHREQLNMLFSNVAFSTLVSMVVSCTLLYLLWPFVNHRMALVWFSILILLLVLRAIVTYFYNKYPDFISLNRWHLLFITFSSSVAIVWGMTSWLLFPESSTEYQILLLTFIAGLAAGSITTLAAAKSVFVPFLLLMITPIVIRFFSIDSDLSNTLAFISLFFMATLLISARKINLNLIENLELRIQSDIREKQLQLEYSKSQQYLDIAGVLIVTLDLEGDITLLNQKACKILGYKQDEILHKNWFDYVIPPENRKELKKLYHQGLEQHEAMKYYENEVLTKAGEKRLIAWHNRQIKDNCNNILGSISSGEDITEKKQAEIQLIKLHEQLVESEKKYRRLFEFSDDPMLIIVAGKFKLVNNSASKILGYDSSDELIGITPLELSPEFQEGGQSSYDKANTMIKQALENGYHRFSWLHKKKNGQIFPVEVTLTKISFSGTDALSCIWRDMSIYKATEKALIDARIEAEKSAQAKGQFLATMSHEIRTPMNGVLGISELLAETNLNHEQKDYVDTILNSGKILLDIINDILDFSKVDSGEMKLDPIDFNLQKAVKDVVDLLSTNVSNKGIDLIVDISSDCPVAFCGDVNRLRQVLLNLIGNAIKFTEKGHVVIRVTVQKQQGKNVVLLIAIEDTGIGIDPQVQKKLFSPFTQADTSTTRTYGGTGLGLSISKRIIELMHGKISLESVPGEGSTFSFTLPLITAELEQSSTVLENKEVIHVSNARILLVEDNVTNQKIATAMLKRLKHKVTIANNGQEAVETYKNNSFDVIFMDCQMPLMDGFEATKLIRNEQKNSFRVPIIALTANVMESDRQLCLDAGMDDFLSKPVKKNELELIISRYVHPVAKPKSANFA